MLRRKTRNRLRIEPGQRLGCVPVSARDGRPLADRLFATPETARYLGETQSDPGEGVRVLTLTPLLDGTIAVATDFPS